MNAYAVGLVLGAMFVTPLVLVYFLFVRWCDRFEPEPLWLLVLAFGWGAVFATIGGAMGTGSAESVVSAAVGVKESHPGIQALGATVFAPIFEEGFKAIGVFGIALLSALGLKEFDGALDGAIYGGVVGLGFTLTEDILYVAGEFVKHGLGGLIGLFFVRTVLLGLSHCTFTACTGLAVGIAAERGGIAKVLLPPIGLFFAMCMHAFHNGLPTFFGEPGAAVMILTSWIVDLAFFALLAVLVSRDRAVVVRELSGEVGVRTGLLLPAELAMVASYTRLGSRNLAYLLSHGWAVFSARRSKQLALVELAFVKMRRRRGESGRELDVREAKLRQTIAQLTARGVRLD
jgi:RsiW-degrading membrane proteinase PrsW (M82 family)